MAVVAITGLGASCAMGRGVPAIVAALERGQAPSAAGRLGLVAALGVPALAGDLAAEVCREATADLEGVEALALVGGCTAGHLCAVELSLGAVFEDEPWGPPSLPILWSGLVHEPTVFASRLLRSRAPRLTLSTACTSSAVAIGAAADMVASGEVPAVLAFGVDTLSEITQLGFHGMGVLSPRRARPLSADREGMWLGDGAAALLLEDLEHARARGATVLAVLLGHGNRSDAFSMSSPHPEGRGARAAIHAALGPLTAVDVDVVCAHATGTLHNDAMELEVLGDMLPHAAVVAYKGATGHTLGAAGALEAVLSVEALAAGRLLPSVGAGPAERLDLVRESRQATPGRVLSVNFAFGGGCTALLFGGADEVPDPPAPRPEPGLGRWMLLAPAELAGQGVLRPEPPARPEGIGRGIWRRASRLTRLVLAVGAPLLRGRRDLEELGIVLGSVYGEIGSTIQLHERWVREGVASPLAFQSSVHSAPVGILSMALGCRGPVEALSAAGATSLAALSRGLSMVREGHAPAALVIVADHIPPLLERALPAGRAEPVAEVAVAVLVEPGGRLVQLGARPPGPVVARTVAMPRELDFSSPPGVRPAEHTPVGCAPSPGLALLLSGAEGVVERDGPWEIGAVWRPGTDPPHGG